MNSNIKKQGITITQTLNELYKFYDEVNLLNNAIKSKLPSYFKEKCNKFSITDDPITTSVSNDYLCEWIGSSFPISDKKSPRKKANAHLSYQLSLNRNWVVDESIQTKQFPLVHVIHWTDKLDKDNCFSYPIKKSDYLSDDYQGKFVFLDNFENSVIGCIYDYGFICWIYSVELLSINSSNIEDLLFSPAIELLDYDNLNLDDNENLNKFILKYPSLETFLKE